MKTLTPTEQKYILHWGEMGARWGINRTVAQIHALLFLSPEPLNAEVIATTLGVARSNVSTSLRELQGWGIVRAVHVLGDRRVHFESTKNVWELFRTIVDQRKRREIDPTLETLRKALDGLDGHQALGLLAFDCAGRRTVLGDEGVQQEIGVIGKELGDVPYGGFYTNGEIARLRGSLGMHHFTLVTLALA